MRLRALSITILALACCSEKPPEPLDYEQRGKVERLLAAVDAIRNVDHMQEGGSKHLHLYVTVRGNKALEDPH